MKRMLLCCCVAFIASVDAMDVKVRISSKEVLRERFQKQGLSKLIPEANIVDALADQDKNSDEIVKVVSRAFDQYFEEHEKENLRPDNSLRNAIRQILQSKCFGALLSEYPAALAKLEENESYDPEDSGKNMAYHCYSHPCSE